MTWETIGWISAAIVGAAAVAKAIEGLLKFLTHIRTQVIEPVYDHFKKVAVLLNAMDGILQEFAPNGGTTMRDAINRIEVKLGVTESKMDALIYDHKFAIFTCDATGRNTLVNRTYWRMLGCDRADLLGFGWKDWLADPELESRCLSAFQDSREIEMDLLFRHSNGQTVRAKLRTYSLRSSTGDVQGFIGLLLPLDTP